MRVAIRIIVSLLFGFVLSTAAGAVSNPGNVVSFPSLTKVQQVGGPQYPKIFVEGYGPTLNGANFSWTEPCPASSPGVGQIPVTGVISGCYVQSTAPFNSGATTVGNVVTFSNSTGTGIQDGGVLASGLVTSQGASTDGNIAIFSGSTGKIITDGSVASQHIVVGPTSSGVGNIAVFSSSSGNGISEYPLTPSDVSLSGEISSIRDVLLRSVNAKTFSPTDFLQNMANTAFSGATVSSAYGISTTLLRPDGLASGGYNSVWPRDMAMAQKYLPAFDANTLSKRYLWVKQFVPTNGARAYQVPDHIDTDGTIHWQPGTAVPADAHAPADGNTYLVQLLWQYYVKSGDVSQFVTDKNFIINLLTSGLTIDAISGCVYIDPSNPYTGEGFRDGIKSTGIVFTPSVFLYTAWLQVADMAYAAGDNQSYALAVSKAKTIKNYLNSHFFVYTAGSTGLYKMSDGLNSGQPDLTGSVQAVYSGVATKGIAQAISGWLASNYSSTVSGQPAWNYYGQVRQVPKGTYGTLGEYSPGSAVYESYWGSPSTYGQYQNGGYWSTWSAETAYTLAMTRPDLASRFIYQAVSEWSRQTLFYPTQKGPFEWVSYNDAANGHGLYIANAASLLTMDTAGLPTFRALFKATISSSPSFVIGDWLNIANKTVFDTVIQDDGHNFDATHNWYVVLIPKNYSVDCHQRYNAPQPASEIAFRVSQSRSSQFTESPILADIDYNPGGTPRGFTLSGHTEGAMYLTAGASLEIYNYVTNASVSLATQSGLGSDPISNYTYLSISTSP